MSRPSFEHIYMALAVGMSQRSTCKRVNHQKEFMQVGCAITTPDFRKVLSVGYNGNASGLPNQCDSDTPGACGCLHAEENAVINMDSPRSVSKVVFCTHLPCPMCAKRLINMGGVLKVFYLQPYRITTSLSLFDVVGIQHEQMIKE